MAATGRCEVALKVRNPIARAWIAAAVEAGYHYNDDIKRALREGLRSTEVPSATGRG